MKLEDFKSVLDDYGLKYRESGVSLAIQECPACGSSKFKVLFRVHGVRDNDEYFFGRCQRGKCEENYSSMKYLMMMGVEREDAVKAHGLDPKVNIESLIPNDFNELEEEKEIVPLMVAQISEVDVSDFIKISAWPKHPASVYAIKRGVVPHWFNDILIDHKANAVVFLIKENGAVIGYQKRFVKPTYEFMKDQTSSGFKKSEHIMEFAGDGDIVICEGPFTALSAWLYGFHGVCTFGSFVSDEQMVKVLEIAEKTGKKIGYAVENGDDASKKGLRSVRGKLFWKKQDLFRIVPNQGKDLNDAWMLSSGFSYDNSEWAGPAVPDLKIFSI